MYTRYIHMLHASYIQEEEGKNCKAKIIIIITEIKFAHNFNLRKPNENLSSFSEW